jgi:hypothetical protein
VAGSTISNHVTIGVTLGSALYPAPLTITSAGFIDPNAGGFSGAIGLLSFIANQSVQNEGTIIGAKGSSSVQGGAGVDLFGDILTNMGLIGGGSLGDSSGVSAGAGVDMSGGSLANFGSIDGSTGVSVSTGRVTNYGFIYGFTGVNATGGTVINMGEIAAGAPTGTGVFLSATSTLFNTGTIIGGDGGGVIPGLMPYYVPGGEGVGASDSTVTNDGTIIGGFGEAGHGGYGVGIDNDSLLINNGMIAPGEGVNIDSGVYATTNSTIVNNGTILGQPAGAYFQYMGVSLSQASITNTGSGVIAGAVGVSVEGSGTVVNAGTIMSVPEGGVPGDAIAFYFGNSARDLLIDDPGGVFIGNVAAHFGGASLELASATSTGTITGIGSSFSGFGTITVDAGATWVATGSVAGNGTIGLGAGSDLTFTGGVTAASPVHFTANTGTLGLADPAGFAATVYGFQAGDAFDFTSITSAGSIAAGVNGSNDLTLTSGGSLLAEIKLDPAQSFAGVSFQAVSDGSGGTVVTESTPLCFLPGTMITTPDGETPVEQLMLGGLVVTACGTARPIVWIGKGRVLAARNRRSQATPVIVRKGALGPNLPYRDLRVTKAHALWLDDVLIPVEFLVNHRSILWDDQAQEVELYHIELEAHDLLIANGIPAESYRDDGNRWLFQNASGTWDLPPKPPCAPVLTGGAIVDAIWRRLLEQGGPRPSVPLTGDPDLHLLVDGVRLDAGVQTGDFHVFDLPGAPAEARLMSRAAVPQELGLARDPRCLGVAVRRVVVRQGVRFQKFEAVDRRLAEGFHAFEAHEGFRWTDGDAVLPIEMFAGLAGSIQVVLHIGATAQYIEGVAATGAA